MIKKWLWLVLIGCGVILFGCSRRAEEKAVIDFLQVWENVRPFYKEKVSLIASKGFLDISLIPLLHQDLVTNELFCHIVTQRFGTVDAYIEVFSNVSLHYTYLSFSESLEGRSPQVMIRQMDDTIVALESLPVSEEREKRLAMAFLMRKRFEQYEALQSTVSTNWIKVVYRYAQKLGTVYQSLLE